MFNNILVVCVGNICRSPLAEARIRQLAPSLRVDSAGIQALVDHPADPESQRQALLHGMDLSGHKAKQLTESLCLQNDLILVMEEQHVDSVCRISPSARGKVMLLGRWSGNQEIPDPYRKSPEHFVTTYNLIDRFSLDWKNKLKWS